MRLISSRVSISSREKRAIFVYIAEKFQIFPPHPNSTRSNRPSNFSISINYRVLANHFGEARAGRGQFSYIAFLFTVPRKTFLKARDFQRCGGTMRPGHFHFQTTTRSDEVAAGGARSEENDASRGWHTAESCFLFYARHRWNLA